MKKSIKVKQHWCPLHGTDLEGFCVEHSATIRVKSKKCDHRFYCENLKKEKSEKDENRNLH
jgi:hypothetical protein